MMQQLSLARRLVLGAAVWSLIMLVVTGWVLTAINRSQTLQLLHDELDATLVTLTRATDVSADGDVVINRQFEPTDQRYLRPLSGRYFMVATLNEDGGVEAFASSNSVWDWEVPWSDIPISEAVSALGQTRFGDATGPDREPVRIAAKAILLPGLNTPVLLVAGADRRPTDQITRQFLYTLAGAMGVLALGLMVAMIIQVRVGLRPLTRIQEDVSRVRAGEKEKLASDYPTEVQPLTDELNKLLDHNKAVVDRARTHVGNLAHALKTPIAVLMNEARGDDQLSSLVRRQTQAMNDNVQHYLKRAQAAARAEILGARTPVTPAINDLTRLLGRLNRELDVEPGEVADLAFRGERQDLDEMLGNLLENACKFAETTVLVHALRSENGELIIHVDDDGPGLTPEEREKAVERGTRLDETAPGTGLGLSIVTDLAELYSGRFDLSESPDGGLRATLILPLAS